MEQALTTAIAVTKLCPLTKTSCVADRCMFWRWIAQEFGRETELWSKSRGIKVNSAFRDDADWRPAAGAPNDPPAAVGHCTVVRNSTWIL